MRPTQFIVALLLLGYAQAEMTIEDIDEPESFSENIQLEDIP